MPRPRGSGKGEGGNVHKQIEYQGPRPSGETKNGAGELFNPKAQGIPSQAPGTLFWTFDGCLLRARAHFFAILEHISHLLNNNIRAIE
jgi:hypothetical protein